MPPRVDPYSLRLFVTAANEGSIARAAAKEHIAASALSRRIADLEHALGASLFIRSPRGIALTDAGQIAFRHASDGVRWHGFHRSFAIGVGRLPPPSATTPPLWLVSHR